MGHKNLGSERNVLFTKSSHVWSSMSFYLHRYALSISQPGPAMPTLLRFPTAGPEGVTQASIALVGRQGSGDRAHNLIGIVLSVSRKKFWPKMWEVLRDSMASMNSSYRHLSKKCYLHIVYYHLGGRCVHVFIIYTVQYKIIPIK